MMSKKRGNMPCAPFLYLAGFLLEKFIHNCYIIIKKRKSFEEKKVMPDANGFWFIPTADIKISNDT
jgi:hypothetical protein